MEDMVQTANFVYSYYMERVKALKDFYHVGVMECYIWLNY